MKLAPLILLLWLAALLPGCGDDSSARLNNTNNSSTNNANNTSNNTTNPQDMGAPHDMAGWEDMSEPYDDMAGGYDMSATLRPYDPALIDPSPTPGPCASQVLTQPGELRARVFATSFKADLADATSHAAWRARVHSFVWQHVLPCRAPDAPNVVVFPESISLPMLLIGDKAASSRERADSASALALMASSLSSPLAYYQSLYPDAPLPRLILLAATDTLARATLDTFAQIADRHDLYVVVTANAARWEQVDAPALIAQLGDSDHDGLTSAWRATSERVHNAALIFGPDGALLHRADKLYPSELEQRSLGLLPGDFTQLRPVALPWGLTALVFADSARMPNVQDRLDDLGAQVYLAPAAQIGSWARYEPAPQGTSPRWQPDLFLMGPWSLVQRLPRAVVLVVSRLTGNLFELGFDGQVQLIERPGARAGQLIGQRGPLAGNALVGPWVIQDPGEYDRTLTLEQRRAALQAAGEARQPSSSAPERGQYVEGAWGMDLTHAPTTAIEAHPALASAATRTLLALSQGAPGARLIALRALDERGAQQPLAQLAHPDYDLIRPQLVSDTSGAVHLVAEAVGKRISGGAAGAQDNRLIYAMLRPGYSSFEDITILGGAGAWAYHPSLALSNNTLHLTWVQHAQGATRAYYAQSAASSRASGAPFERAVPIALDTRPGAAQQWDARVAAAGQLVAAVWLDQRDQRWSVQAAFSQDAGLSWSAPIALDDGAADVVSLHSSPTITALPGGELLVAWTYLSEAGLSSAIGARAIKPAGRGNAKLGALHLLGAVDDYDRWERAPALVAAPLGAGALDLGQATLAWVEQHQAKTTIKGATYDAALDLFTPRQDAVDAPAGAHALALRPGALVFETSGPKGVITVKPF